MPSADRPRRFNLTRRAIAAVVLGNALEFYDFTIYAFFAAAIGKAFFPAQNATDSLLASLALFGLGYVMRPLGGLLIGALADRTGRRPAMVVTIALMAVGILILAVTPSYAAIGHAAQIIVILGRVIQGLALGGEIGPSTVYLVEAAQSARRGVTASWQIASQGSAALFAGLIASALTALIGADAMDAWGWRVMMLLGLAVVPAGLIIRRHLPETVPATPKTDNAVTGVMRILWRDHKRLLTLSFFVIAASTVSNAIGTNMPTYARATLGLTAATSTAVPIALGAASIMFPLLGGFLADRLGRKPVLIWPRAAILLAVVPAFIWLAQAPSPLRVYTVTFLLSALSSVNAAAIIVALPEALPAAVRSTGLSIIYALSVAIFGGSTNYAVNKLIAVTHDPLAPAWYLAAFSVAGTIAALLMRETRGADLNGKVSPNRSV